MAGILNAKRKLCIVKNNGPIHELGGISGPILAPCNISMRAIINMVQNGRNVYEINPRNMKEMVKLDIKNVQSDNFPKPSKFILPEEKKPEVKPQVVSKDNSVEVKQDNITPTPVEDKLVSIVEEAAKTVDGSEKISVQVEEKYSKKDKKHNNSDFQKK